jgi:demethylmenaquinone methyltransferase/2-methoxy-6-polyprenyl-1,4-benzoquinol methylase
MEPVASALRAGGGAMFDRIAARYDALNRILSLGLDRGWRRRMLVALPAPGRILDLATGTGDVALAAARRWPGAAITALDPSAMMLDRAREKLLLAGPSIAKRVSLVSGEAERLPFDPARFDALTIAFGIRNVADRSRTLREMHRVLEPGGHAAILEFGSPAEASLLARFHIRFLVPQIGRLFSSATAYAYLASSIAAFPRAEEFAAMLANAGFEVLCVERLAFGAVNLFVARRRTAERGRAHGRTERVDSGGPRG